MSTQTQSTTPSATGLGDLGAPPPFSVLRVEDAIIGGSVAGAVLVLLAIALCLGLLWLRRSAAANARGAAAAALASPLSSHAGVDEASRRVSDVLVGWVPAEERASGGVVDGGDPAVEQAPVAKSRKVVALLATVVALREVSEETSGAFLTGDGQADLPDHATVVSARGSLTPGGPSPPPERASAETVQLPAPPALQLQHVHHPRQGSGWRPVELTGARGDPASDAHMRLGLSAATAGSEVSVTRRASAVPPFLQLVKPVAIGGSEPAAAAARPPLAGGGSARSRVGAATAPSSRGVAHSSAAPYAAGTLRGSTRLGGGGGAGELSERGAGGSLPASSARSGGSVSARSGAGPGSHIYDDDPFYSGRSAGSGAAPAVTAQRPASAEQVPAPGVVVEAPR